MTSCQNPVMVSVNSVGAICTDITTVNISGTITGAASTGLWTTSGNGTFGSTTSLSTTYSPSAADIAAGSVTLTLTSTNAAAPCPENSSMTVLTINPLPTVSITSLADVCESASIFPLTVGSPTGGIYSGTGVVGGTDFNPAVAGVGTHTITYTYTDPTTGCINTASTTIIVSPVPVISSATPS